MATNSKAVSNADKVETIRWWAPPSSTQLSQSSAKQWASSPSAQARSESAVKLDSKESDNAQPSEKLSTSKGSVFCYA
jgi:hypothetical protein